MIKRFAKVDKSIYRGSAPTIEDVIFLNKQLAEKHIERTCALLGIKQVIIPILPKKKSSFLEIFYHSLNDLFTSEGPVFIHCLHGKDRTGLLVALFRCIVQKWSFNNALKEALHFGFGKGLPKHVINTMISILKIVSKDNSEDVNHADIVSNLYNYDRDWTESSLTNVDRQSWSPYLDYRVKIWPDSEQYNYYPDQYNSRNDLDAIYDKYDTSKNKIPISGLNDQPFVGTMGYGPSLVGTGFI